MANAPGTPYEALAGIPNAFQPLTDVVTGGQPTEAQLEAFRAAGGAAVLDIRSPDEPRALNERAVTQRLGLSYQVIPVAAGTVGDQTMNRILEAVRQARGRPLLFHCASGNRVGAALIPYFMLDQGMDEETAVTHAVRIGLKSPDLMAWGVEYARRHASSRSQTRSE
jgi:protein tyrosine phosphatase (PTP) superfamily phosphohydrolase (DUF442 family)